jgi:hypothetical protein
MGEVGTCRNDCGHHGPLEADGYCSQACREAALHRQVEEIRAAIAARQAWIREELAGSTRWPPGGGSGRSSRPRRLPSSNEAIGT